MRILRSAALFLLLLVECGVADGCGSNMAAPSLPQLSGVWRGVEVLTRITGDDCLTTTFSPFVGTRADFTISLTQSGTNLTGLLENCRVLGTVTSDAFMLELDPSSCVPVVYGLACQDGTLRDTRVRSLVMSGTASATGNSVSGTSTHQYNVFASGTATQVGQLMEEGTFSMLR